MKPEILQNICNVLILAGLILTAFGGYGTYYFGKRVDKNKDTIILQLNEKLENQSRDIIGYSKGEENPKAYFLPLNFSNSSLQVELCLINGSKYPIFDIRGDWIDIDEPIDPINGRFWTRYSFQNDYLYPNQMLKGLLKFDFTHRDSLRINIFMNFRNGGATGQYRFFKVDNSLKIAYQFTYGKDAKEVHIPKDFPGYDPNQPDKVFE